MLSTAVAQSTTLLIDILLGVVTLAAMAAGVVAVVAVWRRGTPQVEVDTWRGTTEALQTEHEIMKIQLERLRTEHEGCQNKLSEMQGKYTALIDLNIRDPQKLLERATSALEMTVSIIGKQGLSTPQGGADVQSS